MHAYVKEAGVKMNMNGWISRKERRKGRLRWTSFESWWQGMREDLHVCYYYDNMIPPPLRGDDNSLNGRQK